MFSRFIDRPFFVLLYVCVRRFRAVARVLKRNPKMVSNSGPPRPRSRLRRRTAAWLGLRGGRRGRERGTKRSRPISAHKPARAGCHANASGSATDAPPGTRGAGALGHGGFAPTARFLLATSS